MFRLFKSSGGSAAEKLQPEPSNSYTRFSQEEAVAVSQNEPLTRFEPRPSESMEPIQVRPVAQPVQQPKPVREVPERPAPAPACRAAKPKPRINENAHLHASNQIPLWVFQKALPQRFADMTRNEDEFVFQ